MSEIIDRAAKAIYELRFGDLDMVKAEDMVRAVIEAMRVPTEAMIQIGWQQEGIDRGSEAGVTPAWQAMIDEALK